MFKLEIHYKVKFLLCCLLLFWLSGCQAPPPGVESAKRGVDAYQARDFETSVTELEAGLAAGVRKQDEALMWTVLGNSYDELDRYDESIKAHQKSLELDPKSHQAWTNLGATYRHSGEFEKAEEAYTKSLALSPDYPEAHASLGALYIFQDKNEQAIESLQRAIELDSTLAVAHSNLAFAYANAGRFEEADVSLDRAIALGYTNGPVLREKIDALKTDSK